MPRPDYYRVLQCDPDAEPEVIAAAYRSLARRYHPDVNPSAESSARMVEINVAYAVLSDPVKRAEYDASRATVFDGADSQEIETQAAEHPSQWRWLLVVPAFVVGLFIPGLLIRFSWELGTSWIPGMDTLTMRWSELLQSGADGFCAVYFARTVAPRGKVAVSIAAATVIAVVAGGVLAASLLFTNYYNGVGIGTILWNSGLIVVTIAAAGYAVWHTVQAVQGK